MRVRSWVRTLGTPLFTASAATALIGVFSAGVGGYLAALRYQEHPSVAPLELRSCDVVAAVTLLVLGHAMGALSRRDDYARLRATARFYRTLTIDRGYRVEPRSCAHVTNEPALRARFRIGLARRIAWGIAFSGSIVFIGLSRTVTESAHVAMHRPNAWDFCAYFALAWIAVTSHLVGVLIADRGFRLALSTGRAREEGRVARSR